MRHGIKAWLAVPVTVLLAACGGGNGGVRPDGSGGPTDGAHADGTIVLPDGRVVLGDGATPMDGSAMDTGTAHDSGGFDPEAGMKNPDTGVITFPDGAMFYPDGAPVTDSGGPVGDGGTGCGTREICNNGLDDNCDGQIDESCPCLPGATQRCYGGNPAQAGVGVCVWGTQSCTGSGEFGTWSPCMGDGRPQPVVCGGNMDYRCDGMINEGCGCTPGDTRSCYDGPSGTMGVGLCHAGTETCVATDGGADWGPCVGEETPSPELCDGMDHDCDGVSNSGCGCTIGTTRSCYDGPTGTAGVGLCHAGVQSCMAGAGGVGSSWGTCTGEVTPTPDTCDGLDHTCTGMIGVGCPCIIGATQACYTGPAGTRGVGICHDGTQQCVMMGSSAGWSSTCGGQTLPTTEICGNGRDDNCNGAVDESCGPTIMCPADVTTLAGTPVTLTVNASSPGRTIASYNWTITSAPTGGVGTPNQWNPTPPTAMTETFLAYIVGMYTIHVTATDSGGATVSCDTHVTAQGHGLRVELTWDGTGDLDLHLHNGTTTSPWYTTNDCYYGNCQSFGSTTPVLDWDTAGIGGDDPILDFDNTSANGPENTRIDVPVIGETYTVGVHNYANGSGRTATIQIFCGGGTTPQMTYTHSVSGASAGDCTTNTFWRVATVRFTSTTACTIGTLGTIEASSVACSSY